MTEPIVTHGIACPFCGNPIIATEECVHFVGWTTDGRTVTEPYIGRAERGSAILSADRVVKTGVSARVYSGEIR